MFGTVLLGRLQGGEGAERALGLFINTLPLRLDIDRRGVETAAREAHVRLSGLLAHEHAPLALAQLQRQPWGAAVQRLAQLSPQQR